MFLIIIIISCRAPNSCAWLKWPWVVKPWNAVHMSCNSVNTNIMVNVLNTSLWTSCTNILFWQHASVLTVTKNIYVEACEKSPLLYPYQRKSMGMVWKRLGHIWPICGNGMGRLGDDMELIWAIILPNFKLWKMHGKKVEAICHMGKLWENNTHSFSTHMVCWLQNLIYGFDMEYQHVSAP